MAPNPVMGGYVMHVSAERVYDVDLTVEQGIRSIVTSGVATGESDGDDADDLVDLKAIRQQAADNVDDFAAQARRDFASVHPERDPDEVDADTDDSPTHYMIEETEDGEPEIQREATGSEGNDSTDDTASKPASTDESGRDSEE
jgi:hypothetical protein